MYAFAEQIPVICSAKAMTDRNKEILVQPAKYGHSETNTVFHGIMIEYSNKYFYFPGEETIK